MPAAKFYKLFFIFFIALYGCKSRPDPKPAKAEIIEKKIIISDIKRFTGADFAKTDNFNEKIKSIKRISIKYILSPESEYHPGKIKTSLWHKELEKSLIKIGLIINDRDSKKNIFEIEEEDKKKIKCDASIVINKISLMKVKSEAKYNIDNIPGEKGTYTYEFFIAEINGKIVMKNNDIIWSSNITASTFDILKNKKIQPRIHIRGIKDYRYSNKLQKWIRDKYSVTMDDNFQSIYSGKINREFHKRELIKLVISRFIGTITENI